MATRIGSFFLPLALTLGCLSGAMYLGVFGITAANASTDEQQAICANTECEGVKYCRFHPSTYCAFHDFKECANRECATSN